MQTPRNTPEESEILLSWRPERLGHATFLSDELKSKFFADVPEKAMERNSLPGCDMGTTVPHTQARDPNGRYKPCIEICLTSNLM
jgi:adenosine deaminase